MIVPLALTMLAAPACTSTSSSAAEDPTVLTTFTVLADMTRNVAGNEIEVVSLTRPGAEIHSYEPTPDDLIRGQDAHLILANGLGLEAWFTQFTDQIDAPTATLSDGIETIPITQGAYEDQANPHAWMSPDNAQVYVDNIRDALSDLDPKNTATFDANAEAYKTEISEVGQYLSTELDTLPEEHRALVTCEGAFSYLARDAGLREQYLWPVNAETEATPRQVAATVEFVEDNDVPAVFCESTVNDDAQRRVAQESGAKMGGTLYVDSLSNADGPVPTYLDLLRHDATTIVAGLTEQERT